MIYDINSSYFKGYLISKSNHTQQHSDSYKNVPGVSVKSSQPIRPTGSV